MKTYRRPMSGWWYRNPYYLRYILRELSSVFVTAYALILLSGLVRLYQGKPQYDAWRESLSSPAALAFHALILVFLLYHAWTWFKVMPRTMPFLRVGGRRVPDALIVAGGMAASALVSAALLLAASWFGLRSTP